MKLLSFLEDETVDALMIPNPPDKGNLLSHELFRDRFALFAAPGTSPDLPVYSLFTAITGTKKTIGQVLGDLKLRRRVVDVDSLSVESGTRVLVRFP